MRLFKKKNKYVPRQPKKSKKADIRRYSFIFFLIGLNITVWSAWFAFDFKSIYLNESNKANTSVVTNDNSVNNSEAEDEFKVVQIDPEELETLVNTIAYTHAVWPGYKGDVLDGFSVRKHFSQNLAKIIVNNGGIETYKEVKVHFYYVVRDDGAIQYLSLVQGGRTTEDLEVRYIKHVQKVMSIGIPGIKPGTDDKGEPITVVYELLITFTPAS